MRAPVIGRSSGRPTVFVLFRQRFRRPRVGARRQPSVGVGEIRVDKPLTAIVVPSSTSGGQAKAFAELFAAFA
jgi:hypothetical protein